MKKIFNILMIMGMFLLAGYFLVPVYAEEGNEEVVIVDVRQNNNILEHSGNTYQIVDYLNNPVVLFYVKNAKKNTYYNVYFYSNEEDYSLINVYNKSNGIEYYYNDHLTLFGANSTYNVKLCLTDAIDSKTCTEEIANKSLTFNYADYNKLSFDDKSLIITKVMQGDNEIIPVFENDRYHYSITSYDEVKVSLKGTNFDSTVTYEIDVNDNKMYYSGSLINDGITISSYPVNNQFLYLESIFTINNKHLAVKKLDNEELYDVSFDYNTPSSNLRYTVTPSVSHIDTASYQNNKVINFNLKSRGFEDRNYLVRVHLGYLDSQNNNTIFYSEEKTLNGLTLNDGYNYSITGVTLAEPSEAIDIESCLILLEIEGSIRGEAIYLKGDGLIHAKNVYYGDHETYLKEIAGMGYPIMGKGTYSLDMIRDNIDKIYVQYGNASEMLEEDWLAFDDNKEYTYKLTRGYPKAYSNYADLLYEETLATGTVLGSAINAEEFTLEIDLANPVFAQEFYYETYELTIYDDDVALCYVQTQIKRNYGPTIAGYELSFGEQTLTPSGYNKYLVPNEYDLDINMIGLGFDDDTEYSLKLSRNVMGESIPLDPIAVTGSELNNGYLVTLLTNDDSSIKEGSISISVYEEEELIYFDYLNFTFYDKDKEEIQIVSITQDDTDLVLDDGKYVIDDPSKRIILEYKFKNIKPNKVYDYIISTPTGDHTDYFEADIDNTTVYTERLYINPNDIDSGYTLRLCKSNEEHNCSKEITTKEINFSLADFEEYTYSNDKILVTKVMQGGEEVLPVKENGTYKYNLNDAQNIIMSIKGENLKSDVSYYVGYTGIPYMEWEYLSGESLMDGLDLVIPVKNNAYIYFEASLPIFQRLLGLEHREDEDISDVAFEFTHDEAVSDYQFDITYKDELACIQSMKGSVLIDPATYNSKNGIDLLINGHNYEAKDYAVTIRFINRAGEAIFNTSFPVSGEDLNNGYRYYLDELEFAVRENISEFSKGYFLIVNVDNASDQVQLLYNSSGNVNTKAYYSNGIEVIRDAVNPYKISNYQVKYLDSGIIAQNNEVSLTYTTDIYDEFNDNVLYNYEFVKGTMVYEDLHDLVNKTIVDSGTIRGNVLNGVGITKTINITNNFTDDDAYMMVIKNGNEIVDYSIMQFRLTNDPMIIVNRLYDGNEELTISSKVYDINYYHSTKIHMVGANFDDDEDYRLVFDKYNNLSEQNDITSVEVTGATLNSGYDYILDAIDNEEIIYGGMNISVFDESDNLLDILTYNFSYVEKYHPTIKINSVKQEGTLLTKEDDKYLVPEFKPLTVNFEVEGYDLTRNYYIQVFGGTSDGGNPQMYDAMYHEYSVLFNRAQIEGNYTEEPVCPVLNDYTLIGRDGNTCSYEKTVVSYSNPTCPDIEGFDFVLRDGDTCNYQREVQVQTGVEYTRPCAECEEELTPIYETQYEYTTSNAECASGVLNNGVCVITTLKETTRSVICLNGTLDGDTCKLDTSEGYIETYTYVVCADAECERQLNDVYFDVKYEMPELINHSKLYVLGVRQSGIEIMADSDGYYAVNDAETIEVTLQGENLVDEATYYVGPYYDPLATYTGSELNDGVILKIYGGRLSADINLYNNSYSEAIVYAMNDNDKHVALSYRHADNIPDVTYELSYLNYQDKPVIQANSDYDDTYYLNSNYFNRSNPLKIRINSNVSDPDGDYSVRISITKDGQTYYQDSGILKGNRLISGYEYFINNLDLDFVTDINVNPAYKLIIEVNNVSHRIEFSYSSIGNDPKIADYVFYKNDKEHLQTAKGSGGYNYGGPVYTVSDKLFTDHSPVYIEYYPVNDYQDDVTYSYTLEYFETDGLWNIDDRVSTIMKSGTITGEEFNTYGLTLEVSNPNNYTIPGYGLIVKNGDEVLYMAFPRIELKPIATFTSIRVMANNTDATYNKATGKYSIPRDRGVYGIISGIGFDDDKDYVINVGKSYYIDGGTSSSLHTNELVTLSGYDLNHDGVRFMLDNNVSEQYATVKYGSDYNNGDNEYFRDNIIIDYREPDPEVGEYMAFVAYHDGDDEVYYVEPDTFNNGGLDVVISGEGFQDKKYPVSVRVMHGENVIYSEIIDVEGLALNAGYNYHLEDLALEYITTIPEFEYAGYNVDVIINGIRKSNYFIYNSRGEVTPHVYYNNTIKEAKAYDGNNEYYADIRRIKLNRNVLNNNDQLTFKYQGYRFDNNKNYTYEFINDINNDGLYNELFNVNILDQGIISGSKLNNEGYIKKININPSTFDYYGEYVLIIRSGLEIVYYSRVSFSMVNTPMVTNYDILVDQNVITKNRDTYLLNYHTDATMMINGIDFSLNKDYRISIDEHYEDYCDVDDNCVPRILEYVVKGSKLNEGFNYMITVNDNEEIEFKYITIAVTDIALEEEIDWTTVYIKYATPLYFFDEETKYTVDDDLSLIRDIKKETEFVNFINNISTFPGISVSLFDVTGQHEITSDIVGTGMILKVLDEDSYEDYFFPIVIKGDISGDGQISISDIIRVKKHLINIDILSGIYEAAGDVTNTGSITATDLVNMARDLAKIEELG